MTNSPSKSKCTYLAIGLIVWFLFNAGSSTLLYCIYEELEGGEAEEALLAAYCIVWMGTALGSAILLSHIGSWVYKHFNQKL